MGPLAGVELHRLIIEATLAEIDQDHLQVVLFTDPSIPDRTTSLKENDGEAFVMAAQRAARLLEAAQVDIIALACMTAHSRLAQVQSAVTVPLLDGVSITLDYLARNYQGQSIALLATDGSLSNHIYTARQHTTIRFHTPVASMQRQVMQGIYEIKGGETARGLATLTSVIETLYQAEGARSFLLGCTELGLLHDEFKSRGFDVIDPMRLVARALVESATTVQKQVSKPTYF